MKLRTWAATALLAGGLTLAGAPTVSAECHEGAVDAANFFVDGELDVNAYLAAVQAALEACAGPGVPGTPGLPSTGSNSSALLPIAVGLTAVGGAVAATAGVRRRSTTIRG